MGKILDIIKENFNENDTFTAHDLWKICKIDDKVLSMNLKRMSNTEILGHFSERNSYYLRSDEEILKKRKEVNHIIDQYGLKLKKYKI